nr:MAG TPA: hypothetical protein [Caudoviricetes sp.]
MGLLHSILYKNTYSKNAACQAWHTKDIATGLARMESLEAWWRFDSFILRY